MSSTETTQSQLNIYHGNLTDLQHPLVLLFRALINNEVKRQKRFMSIGVQSLTPHFEKKNNVLVLSTKYIVGDNSPEPYNIEIKLNKIFLSACIEKMALATKSKIDAKLKDKDSGELTLAETKIHSLLKAKELHIGTSNLSTEKSEELDQKILNVLLDHEEFSKTLINNLVFFFLVSYKNDQQAFEESLNSSIHDLAAKIVTNDAQNTVSH